MPANWYAASLQSNREHQAQKYLQNHCVEVFLPTYAAISRRTDRRVTLCKPLFPGYIFVFVEIPSVAKSVVLKCPGVCGFVSFSGAPAAVDSDVIESLRIITGADNGDLKPHPLVKEGRRVQVQDGPFRGAVGVLCGSSSQKKQLVVEVGFLGRAVAVPVSPEQVTPLL